MATHRGTDEAPGPPEGSETTPDAASGEGEFSSLAELLAQQPEEQRRRVPWILLAVLGGALVVAAAFWAWRTLFADDGPRPPLLTNVIERPLPGVAGITPTPWSNAADIQVVDSTIYLLDSGNNRVLQLDESGGIQAVLCETGDCTFLLDDPRALMVTDAGVYVANTNAGEVNLIGPSSEVIATFVLPADQGDSEPRPVGLALGPGGELYVADEANGWIVRFGSDGAVDGFVGPPGEATEFSAPAGIDIDDEGNLYVAERNQGRIQKISPEGRSLASFSMVADNPEISNPSDVEVTPGGDFVLMADQRRSIVHVFSSAAGYLGIAGLLDATRIDSPSAVQDPRALSFDDGKLYVLDGRRGIEIFDFEVEYWNDALDDR